MSRLPRRCGAKNRKRLSGGLVTLYIYHRSSSVVFARLFGWFRTPLCRFLARFFPRFCLVCLLLPLPWLFVCHFESACQKMRCLRSILISVSHLSRLLTPQSIINIISFSTFLLISLSPCPRKRSRNPFLSSPIPSSISLPCLFTNFFAALCFVLDVCFVFLALRDFFRGVCV